MPLSNALGLLCVWLFGFTIYLHGFFADSPCHSRTGKACQLLLGVVWPVGLLVFVAWVFFVDPIMQGLGFEDGDDEQEVREVDGHQADQGQGADTLPVSL